MGGFAIRGRFAGYPSCSVKTRNALRLTPDHPIGARQFASTFLSARMSDAVTDAMLMPSYLAPSLHLTAIAAIRFAYRSVEATGLSRLGAPSTGNLPCTGHAE